MFCPNCGTSNPDGSSFCSSCGKALSSQEEIKTTPVEGGPFHTFASVPEITEDILDDHQVSESPEDSPLPPLHTDLSVDASAVYTTVSDPEPDGKGTITFSPVLKKRFQETVQIPPIYQPQTYPTERKYRTPIVSFILICVALAVSLTSCFLCGDETFISYLIISLICVVTLVGYILTQRSNWFPVLGVCTFAIFEFFLYTGLYLFFIGQGDVWTSSWNIITQQPGYLISFLLPFFIWGGLIVSLLLFAGTHSSVWKGICVVLLSQCVYSFFNVITYVGTGYMDLFNFNILHSFISLLISCSAIIWFFSKASAQKGKLR